MNTKLLACHGWFVAGLIVLLAAPSSLLAQCRDTESQQVIPNGGFGDQFGRSVSVHGAFAFVGAYLDDRAANDAGAAYTYHFDGTRWAPGRVFTASDASAGASFGFSVSVKGRLAVICAKDDSSEGIARAGAAYVFVRQGGLWTEVQKLVAGDPSAGDQFGFSVSIQGDVIVVGAPFSDEVCPGDAACDSGSAYVFRYDPPSARWLEEQKLTASDRGADDWFGVSVSVRRDVFVVGSVFDDDDGQESGSAYIFRFDGSAGMWREEQKLTASDASARKKFAKGVSMGDGRLVVGSFVGQDPGAGAGAAYVFAFDGTQWSEEQRLSASDGELGDNFGLAVSIDGSQAVVGAFTDDVDRGAAYVFSRSGGRWTEERKLVMSDGVSGDQFGWSVSVSDSVVLVGAFLDRVSEIDTGSASFFSDQREPGCASGTVNTGIGPPADVLFINGSAGNLHRGVRIAPGQPLQVALDAAPSGPNPARYLLLVWQGRFSDCRDAVQSGQRLGCLVYPNPESLPPGRVLPFRCLRGVAVPARFCGGVSELPSPPFAPWALARTKSPGKASVFTVQGLLEDQGAGIRFGFSVTNAVVLAIE